MLTRRRMGRARKIHCLHGAYAREYNRRWQPGGPAYGTIKLWRQGHRDGHGGSDHDQGPAVATRAIGLRVRGGHRWARPGPGPVHWHSSSTRDQPPRARDSESLRFKLTSS